MGQELGRMATLHKQGANASAYLAPAGKALSDVGGIMLSIAPYTGEAMPVVLGIGVAVDMVGHLLTGFLGGEKEEQRPPAQEVLKGVSERLDQLGVDLRNVSQELQGMQRQMGQMMRELRKIESMEILQLIQPFQTFYDQIQTVYQSALNLIEHQQPSVLQQLVAETWLQHEQDVFRFHVLQVRRLLEYLGGRTLPLERYSGRLKARAALALQQVMLARADWFFVSAAFYNLKEKEDALWLAPDLASDLQDYVNLAKGAGMLEFLQAQPSLLHEIEAQGSCGDFSCPRYWMHQPNATLRPGNSQACCLRAPSCEESEALTSPGMVPLDLGRARHGGNLTWSSCTNSLLLPTLVFSANVPAQEVFSASLVDERGVPVSHAGGHAMTANLGPVCLGYGEAHVACDDWKVTWRHKFGYSSQVWLVVAASPALEGKRLVWNLDACPSEVRVSGSGHGLDGSYYRDTDTSTGILYRTKAENSHFNGLQWRSSNRKWVFYKCRVGSTHHCDRILATSEEVGRCPDKGHTWVYWDCAWRVLGQCVKKKRVTVPGLSVFGTCWSSAPKWWCSSHPGSPVCCSR
mmetsp:Transcript_126096/g.368492  ORF Transcript_126096/g.368492 Transcript_126096/m.368492 type:complete len:575 (-) Transcript_126096:30-1754(-)